jgi:transposase-like protein
MAPQPLPQNLIEAVRYFADQDVCTEFVAELRWPNGPVCPRCASTEYSYLTTRRLWKCKGCKKQYSVKLGTIFEDSPIPLDKWLCAIWLLANSKNGVSSYELGRAIGITQKSAWFVLQRIRLAMKTGTFEKTAGPAGPAEIDETYVGGLSKDRRERGGKGLANKTIVIGALERQGRVQAEVIESTSVQTLHEYAGSMVAPGAALYTDGHPNYRTTGLRRISTSVSDGHSRLLPW